jgi:hypothetical protein
VITVRFTGLFACAAIACTAFVTSQATAARAADTASTFVMNAVRASAPPNLDGDLETAAWRAAAHVELTWDVGYQRPVGERTTAYLLYDDTNVYVAFRCWQTTPALATQHTNDVGGISSDDRVAVRFWPDGSGGFSYSFVINPAGAHRAGSSENAAFAPTWRSFGVTRPDGWIAMAAIPLKVMKAGGTSAWRVQFSRAVVASSEYPVWSYDKSLNTDSDVNYAGSLRDFQPKLARARPQPRFALYGLGQAGSPAAGGNTSAVGADVSIPITRKTSLVGTFHPDYSNVELDQQTISPTEFARSFQEVRPFFTQLLNYFNNINCNNCIDWRQLYTPGIPTPRDGYAIEGQEGRFKYAAFDAIGPGLSRADNAQSLRYSTPDNTRILTFQRVGVDYRGLHDVADVAQLNLWNHHNAGAYVTYGGEHGTTVADPGAATWREAGAYAASPTAGIYGAIRKIGSQYAPADGFTEHNDVAGYSLYGFRTWNFGPKAFVQSLTVADSFDLYHGTGIGLNQLDSNPSLNLSTRTQFSLSVSLGDNYLSYGPGAAYDFNQNGVSLGYKTQTSTPSSLGYFVGRFGPGNLRSWFRSTTIPLGRRMTASFEADDTRYLADSGAFFTNWLERASLAYEINRGTSFAAGIRKIVGTQPPVFGPPAPLNATNVSLAFHRRLGADELFAVYGDPNQLRTRPAAIVKYVHYFGAEKGT